MTKKCNEEKLLRFERKVLRCYTYGPTRNPDNGEFERRKKLNIIKLFNRPNIKNVKCIVKCIRYISV